MRNVVSRWLLPVVVATATLALSGCIAAIGNDRGKPGGGNATIGQELMDLQKAKNAGAINDAEYEAQRARLLGDK